MTFKLLILNSWKRSDFNSIGNQYNPMGIMYDHKTHTDGFVYEETELEAYVAQHGVDPATDPARDAASKHVNLEAAMLGQSPVGLREPPRNWANENEFMNGIKSNAVIAVKMRHKNNQHPAIKDNYARFQIYQRNPSS